MSDECQSQACQGTIGTDFSDGNPCTADLCDPVVGVTHPPVSDGSACDDTDLCNGREVCQTGVCAPGQPVVTDDGNECTADFCEPATAVITHEPMPQGTACSPIDDCHDEGACNGAGQCHPGAALAFDDGDPCTIETCDPVEGLTRRTCEPIDMTVATSTADANSWLHEGDAPLQAGVAPGTIAAARGTLVKGRVMSRDGVPLNGAEVRVLGHPELGTTVSQTTGDFSMVVNGGGDLTFQATKVGFLSGDRAAPIPWAESVQLDDLILVQADPVVTEVDLLDESEPFHVAHSGLVDDSDGPRQATVLVPADTFPRW